MRIQRPPQIGSTLDDVFPEPQRDAAPRPRAQIGKTRADRGVRLEHDGRLVIATFHPSYVLRAPDPETRESAFRVVVEALQHAHRLIGEHGK